MGRRGRLDPQGTEKVSETFLGSCSVTPVTRTPCVMGKRNYKDFGIALGDDNGIGEAPEY